MHCSKNIIATSFCLVPMVFKASISFITFWLLHPHFPITNADVKGGYWPTYSSVQISNINSTLFTHLFCAFAGLNNQTFQLTIPSQCTTFSQSVKQNNPSLKTLLSIGGGNAPSSDFNLMASNATSRKTFINSAINATISNGYDGLDLDWEQQSTVLEMENLAALLTEWRAAINNNTMSSNLVLTAALYYRPQANVVATFPTQAISNSLDWVNVMAYDFYFPSHGVTRPHAALYDPDSDSDSSTVRSGNSGISAWINAGVPANKLVLGLPFYGYAWKLEDPNNHSILAPAVGKDDSVSNDPAGALTYEQIKAFINERNPIVVFNESYVTNYCYIGTTWITYDDTETIAAKVSYAKNTASLLGYFAWNIDQDTSDWTLSRTASQTWGP